MKSLIFIFSILFLFTACSNKEPKIVVNTKTKNRILKKLYLEYEYWSGASYKYGGMSEDGIDCSAFVQSVYKTSFKIYLPRTTKQQVKEGKKVKRGNFKAGDLLFFKTSRSSRHVGIYLEKGKFLHASSSKGVTISSLNNPYWKKHYWIAKRVLR